MSEVMPVIEGHVTPSKSASGIVHRALKSAHKSEYVTVRLVPVETDLGFSKMPQPAAQADSSQPAASKWPSWLRPRLAADARPRFVTLTDFARKRSRLVADLDDGPVLLTRRGTVVAALVPLEPGAYEAATREAGFRRAAGGLGQPTG